MQIISLKKNNKLVNYSEEELCKQRSGDKDN